MSNVFEHEGCNVVLIRTSNKLQKLPGIKIIGEKDDDVDEKNDVINNNDKRHHMFVLRKWRCSPSECFSLFVSNKQQLGQVHRQQAKKKTISFIVTLKVSA